VNKIAVVVRRTTAKGAIGCTAVALIAVLSAVLTVVLTRGLDPPRPTPAGSFSFAAMGDAPYDALEELRFRLVLQDLDAHDLTTVISVGDIFWRPCTDEMYRHTLTQFNGLRHPVVYTPGDNEWFDCHEAGSGSYRPQERLRRLREIFFAQPGQSFGRRRIALASQVESAENVRWSERGVVFATVHLIGSGNGMWRFTSRTPGDDVASRQRTEAAAAWTRDTFSAATAAGAPALVIALHGDPFDEELKDREPFQPFLDTLRDEAGRFTRPVLIIHGDGHDYRIDRPLPLPNLSRLEVPGSPDVGWVRITVTPGAVAPFAFERRLIPRWRLW
jgi:hypothetical protein